MAMMTIGLDISKSWFQIHWITAGGEIIRKKFARGKVLDSFHGFQVVSLVLRLAAALIIGLVN